MELATVVASTCFKRMDVISITGEEYVLQIEIQLAMVALFCWCGL